MKPVAGKVNAVIGGQWGSEGKGAAAAWLAKTDLENDGKSWGTVYDIVITNAGAQAGHTSMHKDVKRVTFHLPTYAVIAYSYSYVPVGGAVPLIYLSAGAVIDTAVLFKELSDYGVPKENLLIHPNAAVITEECKEAEMAIDSAQTRIASTRKGVGEAYARRALRSGLVARDCKELKPFIRRVDLNGHLARGKSMLLEVPQGFSLSVTGKFYPHCTSRICTVQQALADADIHPSFMGETLMVVRTFPIRVGNIADSTGQQLGYSGNCYPDQKETSWEELGVTAEITTVTKRVRRVFTFSQQQLFDAMSVIRPDVVMLTFTNYLTEGPNVKTSMRDLAKLTDAIFDAARTLNLKKPKLLLEFGPTTNDVKELQP